MGADNSGNTFELKNFSWAKAFLIFNHKDEKNIIHVHWETNIYGSRYALISVARMILRFSMLFVLKISGVRIVWTMHNLEAHDYEHLWIDKIGKAIMWQIADRIIIQEKKIAEEKNNKKVVWIPQGNYVGVYGESSKIDQKILKKQNGFDENTILLLALGSIRPYKELPKLIEQVGVAINQGANIHLLIAGKLAGDYKKTIENVVKGKNFITLRSEYVPNEKIPEILNMADYTIYYYGESSLSSAAMIMSLSYGTPVITRNIPASEMVQEGKNGFIYKNNDELIRLLKNLKNKSYLKTEDVISTIKDQSWERVAKELREVYINLYK
ncbi:MAG: glycosyltransferase [Minisyncoccota bacterium]